MATLSKDGHGSWRAGGVVVRDARHVHNGPEVCAGPAKTKNTRRWCRGKHGVEHKLVTSVIRETYGFPYLVRHCSTCGKEFGRHGTHHIWGKSPDWATEQDLKALQRAEQEPRVEFRRR